MKHMDRKVEPVATEVVVNFMPCSRFCRGLEKIVHQKWWNSFCLFFKL